jgi:hypothetical protein
MPHRVRDTFEFGPNFWVHFSCKIESQTYVEHLAIRVNGPSEPIFRAIYRDHNLVEMPLGRGTWPIATNTVSEMGTKPVYPQPNSRPTDDNTLLSRKILDLRCAEGEAILSPDGKGNDLAGETESLPGATVSMEFHGQPLP